MKVRKFSFILAFALTLSVSSTAFGVGTSWDTDSPIPFSAMPSGVVVFGVNAYDLNYANDTVNQSEICDALANSDGKVYIKDFCGNWIDNKTCSSADMTKYPEIAYRNKTDIVCYPNTCSSVLISWDLNLKKSSVAQGQSLVNTGSIKLTAGNAASNVKITGIKIECSKLTKDRVKCSSGSADSVLKDLSIWDGSTQISPLTTVTNGIADVSFKSPLAIGPGESKTLAIKVNVSNTAAAGSDILFETGDKGTVKTTANVFFSPGAVGEMTVTK